MSLDFTLMMTFRVLTVEDIQTGRTERLFPTDKSVETLDDDPVPALAEKLRQFSSSLEPRFKVTLDCETNGVTEVQLTSDQHLDLQHYLAEKGWKAMPQEILQ